MSIHQGDVYWLQSADEGNAETRILHPHVVVQQNSLNHDPAVSTVVVCGLTTNMRKISMPGNILLEAGEANPPRQSIVEVSKIKSIDKTQLDEYIGTLSEERVDQIMTGTQFVQRSFLNC